MDRLPSSGARQAAPGGQGRRSDRTGKRLSPASPGSGRRRGPRTRFPRRTGGSTPAGAGAPRADRHRGGSGVGRPAGTRRGETGMGPSRMTRRTVLHGVGSYGGTNGVKHSPGKRGPRGNGWWPGRGAGEISSAAAPARQFDGRGPAAAPASVTRRAGRGFAQSPPWWPRLGLGRCRAVRLGLSRRERAEWDRAQTGTASGSGGAGVKT
jgi:hypothetical protein